MRPFTVDTATHAVKLSTTAELAGPALPPGVALMYFPRVRCTDCTAKAADAAARAAAAPEAASASSKPSSKPSSMMYRVGPGRTVAEFEKHVINRQHRALVAARVAKEAAGGR